MATSSQTTIHTLPIWIQLLFGDGEAVLQTGIIRSITRAVGFISCKKPSFMEEPGFFRFAVYVSQDAAQPFIIIC